MRRRGIERERARSATGPPFRTGTAPRGLPPRARPGWRGARNGGFAAHRAFRLSGIGHAIGGARQRRLRAARAH